MFLEAKWRQGLREAVLYIREKPKTTTFMVPGVHWDGDFQIKCLSSLNDRFLHLLLSPRLTQASASPTPSSVLGQVDGVKEQASVLQTGKGGQLEGQGKAGTPATV